MLVSASNRNWLQLAYRKRDRLLKAGNRVIFFSLKLLLFVKKARFFIGSSGFFPILKHNQRPTSFVAPALIRLQKVNPSHQD